MPHISHPAPLKKFHLSLLTSSLLAAVPGRAAVPEVFSDGYYPLNNIKDRDYTKLAYGF